MIDVLFVASNKKQAPYNHPSFGEFYLSHVDMAMDILKSRGYDVQVNFAPDEEIPAKIYLYTNCCATYDFPWMPKYGKRAYHVHGAGIFKRYGWYPKEHTLHDIIMFPSEGMKQKYEMCHPGLLRSKHHKVLGYSKFDKYMNQLDSGTARQRLIEKYEITDAGLPIILFAPTWGEFQNHLGLKLLNYPNIIFAPRTGSLPQNVTQRCTFGTDKSLEIAGADVIITDISALGTEAGRLGKPIVQLCVTTYPSTTMKHPHDLIIPGLEKYGRYIIGETVNLNDPLDKKIFWDNKIDMALKNQPNEKCYMWSKLCLEFKDNQNSVRVADYLETFLK